MHELMIRKIIIKIKKDSNGKRAIKEEKERKKQVEEGRRRPGSRKIRKQAHG